MIDTIYIYFSGDDLLDRRFAHTIAESVRYYGTPVFHDVDEMDRADTRGESRSEYFKGMALIFVLSPSMLSKPHNRAKLISSAPDLGVPEKTAYYICRGIAIKELRRLYPDLNELFDRVMVGDESDLPEMIAQIRDYAARSKEYHASLRRRISFPLILTARFFLSLLILLLGNIGHLLYRLSFVSPIIIYYFLITSSPGLRSWGIAWSLLALYGIGFGLNSLLAFDFWPWLGRRWRLPELRLEYPDRTILLVVWLHLEWALARFDPPLSSYGNISIRESLNWVTGDCIKQPTLDTSHSLCTEVELRQAIQFWYSTAGRERFALLVWALILLMPAIILLAGHSAPIGLTGLMAVLAGLTFPPLYYWATNFVRKMAFFQTGLTKQELRHTERKFDPVYIKGRVLLQTIHSARVRRRWFRITDKVFISYSWEDERNMPVATSLAKSLEKLGVHFFWDKKDISAKFSPWRSQVSTGLLDCTHLFIIIGPNIVESQITLREIKMSLQRWHTELFPSVISVVDPDIATALMQDSELPSDLRFALTWCPRLTYAEASDQELVGYLLRQRRRQGLLRDLATILLPGVAIKRTIIEAQTQMTHLNNEPNKRFDRSRRSEF